MTPNQIFISLGGGLPSGLDGMMNNPAMKEAMAKVGGADGLADLMKNPQMMAMAQKMMKDPKVCTYVQTVQIIFLSIFFFSYFECMDR